MDATPTRHAGPAEDARQLHRATLGAFRDAVTRGAGLWRQTADPDAPVPGLTWTAGETAAHVVGDLRDYTQALTGNTATDIPSGSPSRLSAAVNARHLSTVRERNLARLADMLEEQASRYLAVAADVPDDLAVPTPNGLVLCPPTMTSLLLGEQLIHGLDIARSARRPWSIGRSDALLVVPGVLACAPRYLHPVRGANVRVSFELRIRGGGRYRMSVRDGMAAITVAGEKADCVITADPVAFLLSGYGRIPQWVPIIRGQLLAHGRKPWLAMKFATLLTSP